MSQSLARTDHSSSLEAFRQVVYELQAAPDIAALCTVATSYIQNYLGYELIWIGLYDAEAETLEGPWCTADDTNIHSKKILVLPGDLFDQVLLTRRLATIPSLQEDNRGGEWQQMAQDQGIQGTVLQTIRYRKESLGVLLVGSQKWGISPRQDESEHLTILANTIGATVKYLQSCVPQDGGNSKLSSDQALKKLLPILAKCQSWDAKLISIAATIESRSPISGLYLLDADSGEFIGRRIHNIQRQTSYRSRKPSYTVNYHQNASFFNMLEQQPNLAVGDTSSSVGMSVPHTLVSTLDARAFLFQPVLVNQSLVGFWVLADPEPTQWSSTDKDALAQCASLVELTYPASTHHLTEANHMDETGAPAETCELPSPLSTAEEWNTGLNLWLKWLTQRFQCEWSILLDHRADSYFPDQYFCTHRPKTFSQSTRFHSLSQIDEKLIARQNAALDVVNLNEDVRLIAWRDLLLSQGVQSILVSRLSQEIPLQGVLIVGNATARRWRPEEADELQALADRLQHVRNQRAAQTQILNERLLSQRFRQGLQILQNTKSSQSFVEQAAKIVVQLFNVKGCGILLWPPGRTYAKVKAAVSPGSDQFAVPIGTKVELSDPLIHTFIQPATQDQILMQPVGITSADFSEETQRWLFTREEWSLVGIPLQPQPRQTVFGVLFMADPQAISLSDDEKETLSDLARHMAWILSSSHATEAWRKDYTALHTAHWCQNKLLGASFEQILGQCQPFRSEPRLSVPETATEAIASIDQSITRLYDFNAKFIPPLELETESITLVRLLRELLDQLESTFAAKQIWVQVHHLKQSNVAIKSSKAHLVYVLDEVLKAAAVRSETGGRIDVWCRMNQPEWLELSITDNGRLDPRFLRDLNLGHHRDRLKPSLLMEDLGHRLLACRSLVKSLGGKLDISALEDQRTMTRFILPCVTDEPGQRPSKIIGI
ncbi:MAG: ATP-binding protein [Cyanobacteria bacterium P01_F01_bin.42]